MFPMGRVGAVCWVVTVGCGRLNLSYGLDWGRTGDGGIPEGGGEGTSHWGTGTGWGLVRGSWYGGGRVLYVKRSRPWRHIFSYVRLSCGEVEAGISVRYVREVARGMTCECAGAVGG